MPLLDTQGGNLGYVKAPLIEFSTTPLLVTAQGV